MHLTAALSALSSEHERLVAERDALDAFAREVAAVEPRPAGTPASGDDGVIALATTPVDGAIRTVRRRYRETVLAARPDDENRALSDHLAADFGREIATALTGGGPFTPHLQESLLHACAGGRRRRETLATRLEREIAEIEDARDLVRDARGAARKVDDDALLDLDYDDLFDRYVELCELEERCERALRERQDRLGGRDDPDGRRLRVRCYRDLDVRHPVLADLVTLVEELLTARQRVSRALARRV